jgi:hypothetical protein
MFVRVCTCGGVKVKYHSWSCVPTFTRSVFFLVEIIPGSYCTYWVWCVCVRVRECVCVCARACMCVCARARERERILVLNLTCKQGIHRFFQKYRSHLRILGSGNVIRSKFYAEDSQILGATLPNLFARTIWRPEFMHLCFKHLVELPGRGIGPSQNLHVRRKTQNEDTKTCFIDSCGIRSRHPVVERSKTLHAIDSAAIVIGCRALWDEFYV